MHITLGGAALFIFLSSIAAGIAPLYWKWSTRSFALFVSFGAGVLLTTAFVHMLPVGYPLLGERLGAFTLLGFLIIFLLERFGPAHSHNAESCHHVGISALVGLCVHSVVGGVALGASLQEDPSSALSLTLLTAILVHKVPECLATAALLLQSHWPRSRTVIAMVILALAEPLGLLFASQTLVSPYAMAVAIALAAGTFIYVSAVEFLPGLFRSPTHPWAKLFAFFLGIALVFIS